MEEQKEGVPDLLKRAGRKKKRRDPNKNCT